MNKTVIFLAFVILAALGLTGSVVIITIKPESTATFTNLLITILGLATSAAVTFYGLGKNSEKLDKIAGQTNGTLSALREENAALHAQVLAAAVEAPAVDPGPAHRADV